MEHDNLKSNDFYIGWQEKMPAYYSHLTKQIVGVLFILVFVLSILLVFTQTRFEGSQFELGSLSEIEGILTTDPVPMIKIKSSNTQSWTSVLLIGFGKFGAEKTLKEIEAEIGFSLTGKWVKMKGTKIYHEGKFAFELTEGVGSYMDSKIDELNYQSNIDSLGRETLFGEILDPKCALGVMKPGFGKVHRSCAIRCIAGGIPPIFRIQNEAGKSNYIILKGPDGEDINAEVLPYVADQMRLCGRLEKQDDWLVLYSDPENDFLRLKPQWMSGELVLCSQ